MCSIIMTYRCVHEIGRHTRIFSKSDNEYVIVNRQSDDDFWEVFPLNRPARSTNLEEETDTVGVLRAAREASTVGTSRGNGRDERDGREGEGDRVVMVNNFVGGGVEPDFGVVCHFRAKTVESLEKYMERQGGRMSYSAACLLLVALHSQYEKLLCKRKMIPFYSLKDIIVVDDVFLYANPSKLLDVRRFRAKVNVPYNRHNRSSFYAPEIWNRRTIPYYITPEATLFSMAYMITVCLFGDLPVDYEHDESQWGERLDQIYSTKMYWCLLRCLYTAPEKRQFVII